MSAVIYNDSGATLYAYKRSNPSSGTPAWSAGSPTSVSNGAAYYTSGGGDSGLGLSTTELTVGDITDDTKFDRGCWVNASATVGSPSQAYADKFQIQSAGSDGDCGGNTCHSTLTSNGSWNNPLAAADNCTNIQIWPKIGSRHDISSDYIFNYHKNTIYEWDNTLGTVCPGQVPFRIRVGGAPSLRGQAADEGRFYRTTEGETRHHSNGRVSGLEPD